MEWSGVQKPWVLWLIFTSFACLMLAAAYLLFTRRARKGLRTSQLHTAIAILLALLGMSLLYFSLEGFWLARFLSITSVDKVW